MTDTEAGLLRAVLERPDDDLPRLVLADWLEEHGRHSRAEFIRLQVELATMPEESHALSLTFPLQKNRKDVKWKGKPVTEEQWDKLHKCFTLEMRARELFKWGDARGACGLPAEALSGYNTITWDDYSFEVRSIADESRFRFEWSRGFVSAITSRPTDFHNYAKTLFRQHPIAGAKLFGIRPSTTDRDPGFKNYYCWEVRWSSPIWFLMKGGHLKCGLDSWRDTEKECLQDLSDALVAYGREAATVY